MRRVFLTGTGCVPVQKTFEEDLRTVAKRVITNAVAEAGHPNIDALYVSNMLSDELQGQKHLGPLFASVMDFRGIEAMEIKAASASGGAALRAAYLAVGSGAVDNIVVLGIEKMSDGETISLNAKGLDQLHEVGDTMLSANAMLMQTYLDRFKVPKEDFFFFAENAHHNAMSNPNALFHKEISREKYETSVLVAPPLCVLDCSPVCDGAAAIVLSANSRENSIELMESQVATDTFTVANRKDPLHLFASEVSAKKTLSKANLSLNDLSIFELHDAFSIMACLALEAVGFSAPGKALNLAKDGAIRRDGKIPIATMGGLKGRGHPIGATAIYQTIEIFQQLTGKAGEAQIPGAHTVLMQSIGGAASTIISQLFRAV